LPGYNLSKDIVAISVRQGLSDLDMEKKYSIYSLNVAWKDDYYSPPYSGYETVDVLRLLISDICRYKPKNKTDFVKRIKQKKAFSYRTKTPISIYKLKNGQLQFAYTEPIAS